MEAMEDWKVELAGGRQTLADLIWLGFKAYQPFKVI